MRSAEPRPFLAGFEIGDNPTGVTFGDICLPGFRVGSRKSPVETSQASWVADTGLVLENPAENFHRLRRFTQVGVRASEEHAEA